MNRAVVVTGLGAVTPFGVGVKTMMEALCAGRSAVRSMGEQWNGAVDGTYCRLAAPAPDIDLRVIPRKYRRAMGRGASFAYLAASEALAMSGLGPAVVTGGRVGVILGNTLTSPTSLEEFFASYLVQGNVRQLPANGFFRIMGHSCAANIATALGVTGRVQETPAACASGTVAIGVASELIRHGVQDAMICGGVEECHPTTTATFDILGASAGLHDQDPARAPAPFDRDRDGTVCGEGSGVLILESADHARARGAVVLGRLLGFASGADGTQMAQSGVAPVIRCIRGALADAGLRAEQIGYINAHATATVAGDRAEAEAIRQVFGSAAAVSALKGYLGHLLGASGAVEAIATLEMMRLGLVLPTGKLVNVDPECEGIGHQMAQEKRALKLAMKCSFGFGGVNAALVFAEREPGTRE